MFIRLLLAGVLLQSSLAHAEDAREREELDYEMTYQQLVQAAKDLKQPIPPRIPRKPDETLSERDQHLVKNFLYYARTGLGIDVKDIEKERAKKIKIELGKKIARQTEAGLKVDSLDPLSTTRNWWRLIHSASESAAMNVEYWGQGLDGLLEAGADPNALNARGQTALITVAKNSAFSPDALAVITQLLKHGADPSIKDAYGKTAQDYLEIYLLTPKRKGRAQSIIDKIKEFEGPRAAIKQVTVRARFRRKQEQIQKTAKEKQPQVETPDEARWNHPARTHDN